MCDEARRCRSGWLGVWEGGELRCRVVKPCGEERSGLCVIWLQEESDTAQGTGEGGATTAGTGKRQDDEEGEKTTHITPGSAKDHGRLSPSPSDVCVRCVVAEVAHQAWKRQGPW